MADCVGQMDVAWCGSPEPGTKIAIVQAAPEALTATVPVDFAIFVTDTELATSLTPLTELTVKVTALETTAPTLALKVDLD
mgnify:CR=1 FL=1